MQLNLLRGNEDALHALKQALLCDKLSHAVLLCGQDGCGRNFAARCLAADYLFGQGDAKDAHSDAAISAVMQAVSGEVLTAVGEGASGQISAERIREIRANIFRSSLSAFGRVVHVRDAHRMTSAAANALLKVLEEPPPNVLFVLTAPSAAQVFATIASRCAMYTLSPLSLSECGEMLSAHLAQGQDAQLAAQLSALYGGRCGLGIRALQDEQTLASVLDAILAAGQVLKGDSYALAALLSRYEGRGEGERGRREALLENMACALNAAMNGRTLWQEMPLAPDAAKTAAAALPHILEAVDALRRNALPKLCFTSLVIHIEQSA